MRSRTINDLIAVGPVSALRQRLIDDITMRRFSRETQRNYLRDVGRFATWLGRSPHTATAKDVRRCQIEQQDAGVLSQTSRAAREWHPSRGSYPVPRPARGNRSCARYRA